MLRVNTKQKFFSGLKEELGQQVNMYKTNYTNMTRNQNQLQIRIITTCNR